MHPLRKLRVLWWTALLSLAAAAPATAPADASPPQTGEITLKFTQRSPLSSRKELARRLNLHDSKLLGEDYDLATYTFRVYVPPNYDPKTPYGVFVYLGNHHGPPVHPERQHRTGPHQSPGHPGPVPARSRRHSRQEAP